MIKGHIDLPKNMDLSALNWQEYFSCYKQMPIMEKYYTDYNSSIWQMFNESPDWVHNLAKLVPQDFDFHEVSITQIPPGQTVPYHQDKHYILQKNYGKGDTWRYLIMLEDWKMGHYFEIHNKPFVEWYAGDWIKIHRSEWHLAGNMGIDPFYSAQITVK